MAASYDKPLPEIENPGTTTGPHNPYTAVPKRKPVPIAKGDAPTANALAPAAPRRAFLDWGRYSKKKRWLLIASVIAILCLLALVIGLAVGLTRKKGHSNLPLPTSHGGPYKGDLTYYDPALGSCGISSSGSEMICAVSHVLFDAASTGSNPNENPLCGSKLRLRRDGTSVDVKVVDRCVGCKETDLDVSQAVFSQVADLDLGRVVIEWAWLEDTSVSG